MTSLCILIFREVEPFEDAVRGATFAVFVIARVNDLHDELFEEDWTFPHCYLRSY